MIKAITCDWGDTLATNFGMPYRATERRAFAQLGRDLERLGCTVPADFTERCLRELEVDWTASIDPAKNPDNREFDCEALFQRWARAVGSAACDQPAVRRALDACSDVLTDTVIPFAESAPVLAELKRRGYRIGILSHVPWPGAACRRWFIRHGLAPCIDFYALSCEIGWIKPHPAHFQSAIEQAGVAPDEILHVGDHPLRDIIGARRAGMRTALRLTERMHAEADLAACKADAEILHLRELLDLVAL